MNIFRVLEFLVAIIMGAIILIVIMVLLITCFPGKHLDTHSHIQNGILKQTNKCIKCHTKQTY